MSARTGSQQRKEAGWWGSSEVGRGHSNNSKATDEAEADEFDLILPRWVDDRPPVADFSSIRRRATYPPFQNLSWSVERGSSAMCDTQRVLDAKSFSSYLILGDSLVVLRCLPVAGCGHLEMDLTLSAWTANIGTDPFQSGKGLELRKKKYSTTSCPRANATYASEKYTCCCVWCASLHAFNCHEHGLTCRHLVNKLTVSQ